MISSSNFFNKSFFRSEQTEDERQGPTLPLLKRDHLTPWSNNKQLPLQALMREISEEEQERHLRKKRKEESEKISSNLLKESQKKSKLKLPLRSASLPKQDTQLVQHQFIARKLPLLKPHRKQHSERVKSMSIAQFINEQRSQMQAQNGLERPHNSIDNDGQLNFLAKRGNRNKLGQQRKTIDIRRDLMRPLQVLNRKQMVNFSLEAMRREARKGLHDKYRPIRAKERYNF